MSIYKLPTINYYEECEQIIGNGGIRNFMARSRFEDILQNFPDNTKDKKVTKTAKSDLLLTILTRVSVILFQFPTH